MQRRVDELRSLATLWTAALATLVVAIRGGSLVLVVLALPLVLAAGRMTVLRSRRHSRVSHRSTERTEPLARVVRLRPRVRPTSQRRSTAA